MLNSTQHFRTGTQNMAKYYSNFSFQYEFICFNKIKLHFSFHYVSIKLDLTLLVNYDLLNLRVMKNLKNLKNLKYIKGPFDVS